MILIQFRPARTERAVNSFQIQQEYLYSRTDRLSSCVMDLDLISTMAWCCRKKTQSLSHGSGMSHRSGIAFFGARLGAVWRNSVRAEGQLVHVTTLGNILY